MKNVRLENVRRAKQLACLLYNRNSDKFGNQGNHKNKVSLERKVTVNVLMYSCKVSCYFVNLKKKVDSNFMKIFPVGIKFFDAETKLKVATRFAKVPKCL
jgi:hypothetical protein